MCLRQVTCPSCFSVGMTTELDPNGDKITCPAFGLYSSPAEYSTMGRIVLDMTSLAYQPTTMSRERCGHPRRHVNFAMSERKTAYPAHAQDMYEDEDERPIAQRDHTVVSDDGDGQPLVQSAPKKEPAKEMRDPATDDGDLAPLVPPRPPSAVPVRRRKRPPVWQDPIATLEHEARVSEQRMPRFWAKTQKVKLSTTFSTSCLTSATCGIFT